MILILSNTNNGGLLWCIKSINSFFIKLSFYRETKVQSVFLKLIKQRINSFLCFLSVIVIDIFKEISSIKMNHISLSSEYKDIFYIVELSHIQQ